MIVNHSVVTTGLAHQWSPMAHHGNLVAKKGYARSKQHQSTCQKQQKFTKEMKIPIQIQTVAENGTYAGYIQHRSKHTDTKEQKKVQNQCKYKSKQHCSIQCHTHAKKIQIYHTPQDM